jgi:hypothetical protein
MNPKETARLLQKVYYLRLLPAVALIVLAYLLQYFFHLTGNTVAAGLAVTVAVTTLSGVAGVAIPVFYRSYFVHRVKDKKVVAADEFIGFERALISIALLTPYFLALAMLMNMSQTALILITLFSLYAGYYHFPTEKKVRFEMRLFRIKPMEKK